MFFGDADVEGFVEICWDGGRLEGLRTGLIYLWYRRVLEIIMLELGIGKNENH